MSVIIHPVMLSPAAGIGNPASPATATAEGWLTDSPANSKVTNLASTRRLRDFPGPFWPQINWLPLHENSQFPTTGESLLL